LGSGESFMGTVPPGLLSWQPLSLTLLFCSSEKSPSLTALPKRIPNVRHLGRANTTGLIVLQQQQLSESKLNGVSHVQSERRRRSRLRERRCDGSEQVLREYTLHSNSFNSSTKLVWQLVAAAVAAHENFAQATSYRGWCSFLFRLGQQ